VSVIIESEIKPTHKLRVEPVEAWLYTGQPKERWPDWVRSHFENIPTVPVPNFRKPRYAVRDDEGYFWRWLDVEKFESMYEKL